MPPPPRLGEEGMVEMEYQGESESERHFIGPWSGKRYRFGGERRLGYVDCRDAKYMVAGPFREANNA